MELPEPSPTLPPSVMKVLEYPIASDIKYAGELSPSSLNFHTYSQILRFSDSLIRLTFLMASKIIGLAILTNPRPVEENKFVYFDANFWLAEDMQALACLRYFNRSRRDFVPDDAIPCFVQASVSHFLLR